MLNEIWLTTEQTAELMQVKPRMIRRKCQCRELEWEQRKPPKGGRPTYFVNLASLPTDAQKKFTSELSKAVLSEKLPDMPDWKRNIAFERFEVLKAWATYAKDMKCSEAACVQDFINEKLDGKHSKGTLYRWKKCYKEGGIAGLAPDWNNGRERFEPTVISPEAKKWVEDLWLHQNLLTMKIAYKKLREKAAVEGWVIPAYTTIRRLLNAIPEPVKLLRREGQKAYRDKALPSILRDPSDLMPLQIVESDHHQIDIAVIWPDGRVGFAWLTAWMDVRTRKILSWCIVSKPSSDSINISLQELIIKYGKPEMVHLDNGKDYRCKLFTGKGRKKWVEDDIKVTYDAALEGIYNDLGIKTSWAKPYNAKGKIIERAFKTFRTEFSVFWRGYRGKDVTEKPENLKDEWRTKNLVNLDTLKKGVQCFINDYNAVRPHSGKGMEDRTPDAVFFELKKSKKAVRVEELALLCSRVNEKTVEKNGIHFMGDWYINEKIMFEYLSRKVRFRYNDDDISRIFVFDLNGRFLGVMEKYNMAKWMMESEDYRKHMRYVKNVDEARKEWEKENLPQNRMTAEERESLVFSPDRVKSNEPKLQAVFEDTRYTEIIEEIEALDREKEKRQRELDVFSRQYAVFDEPKRDHPGSDLEDFYKKYGGFNE